LAQHGGATLFATAGSFLSVDDWNTRSVARLKEVLKEDSMIMRLLILMGQQLQAHMYASEIEQMKVLGETIDKAQETFLQSVQFAKLNIPARAYSDMLPVQPLKSLVRTTTGGL
jgi:hypothetical protein